MKSKTKWNKRGWCRDGMEKSQNEYYKTAVEVLGQKKSITDKNECSTKRTPWESEKVWAG